MVKQQKHNPAKPHPPTAEPSEPLVVPLENIATRYLDLWQDNLRHWATDPDALDKWLNETAQQIKSPDENTPE
ncbi:MAG: hypothetical protein JKY59_04655 [Emcibacter sp.]|nr:hypothetical protein [Emcibacter sp.]